MINMAIPTMEEVEKADRVQICTWFRFTHGPGTDNEVSIINRIVERFDELGGMTPDISKQIDEIKRRHNAKH